MKVISEQKLKIERVNSSNVMEISPHQSSISSEPEQALKTETTPLLRGLEDESDSLNMSSPDSNMNNMRHDDTPLRI
jgi:hypothetical protein